jgi:hypothetical protein
MGKEDFISFSIILIFFACKHYVELQRNKPQRRKNIMHSITETGALGPSRAVDRPREEAPERERMEPNTDCLRPASPALPATAIADRRISTGSTSPYGNGKIAKKFTSYLQKNRVNAFVERLSSFPEEEQQWAVALSPLVFDRLCAMYMSGELNAKSKETLENMMEMYYGGAPESVDDLAKQLGYEIKDCGGSGNNCMLLSALAARDALVGKNPPADGYKAAAAQLREQVCAAIKSDLDRLIDDFKQHCSTRHGIETTGQEMLIKEALDINVSEKGSEQIARLRGQLESRVKQFLGEGAPQAVVDGLCRQICTDLTNMMGNIGKLNGLLTESTGSQSILVDAASYVTPIIGHDIIVAKNNASGPGMFFIPKPNSSLLGRLPNALTIATKNLKIIYRSLPPEERPIMLSIEGNGYRGHYRAFVPKATRAPKFSV